jgi:hypothetical protein
MVELEDAVLDRQIVDGDLQRLRTGLGSGPLLEAGPVGATLFEDIEADPWCINLHLPQRHRRLAPAKELGFDKDPLDLEDWGVLRFRPADSNSADFDPQRQQPELEGLDLHLPLEIAPGLEDQTLPYELGEVFAAQEDTGAEHQDRHQGDTPHRRAEEPAAKPTRPPLSHLGLYSPQWSLWRRLS